MAGVHWPDAKQSGSTHPLQLSPKEIQDYSMVAVESWAGCWLVLKMNMGLRMDT